MKKIISFLLVSLFIFGTFLNLPVASADEEDCSVTVFSGVGGSVSPNGVVAVKSGSNITLTLKPNFGYRVSKINVSRFTENSSDRVMVNNEMYEYPTSRKDNLYTIKDIYTSIEVYVEFSKVDLSIYTVNISHNGTGAGPNATKSYEIAEGDFFYNVFCDIKDGYAVRTVTINGEIMFDFFNIDTYDLLEWNENRDTFNFKLINRKVYGKTDIVVEYIDKTNKYYVVNSSCGKGGKCTYNSGFLLEDKKSSESLEKIGIPLGEKFLLTIKADAGYTIKQLLVDDTEITEAVGKTTYQYESEPIRKEISVSVVFQQQYAVINVDCSANGVLDVPEGNNRVELGEDFLLSFTPDPGYLIEYVIIDGEENNQAKIQGYWVFSGVTDNHAIYIKFVNSDAAIHELIIGCSPNGDVSPKGSFSIGNENTVEIHITPDAGYTIGSITINNVKVPLPSSYLYTLHVMTQDIVFYVEFERDDSLNHKGDVTLDGIINMEDVTELQKYIASIIGLNVVQQLRADADNDGKINMQDVIFIQREIAGLI